MLKLNIGCINYKDGYIHIDVDNHKLWKNGELVPLDIIADARRLPFKDNEVDEIYTSHMLEHLGRFEYMDALREFYRVLKTGGLLDIEVPDLLSICKQFIEEPNKRRVLLQHIYGGQSFSTDFHKTGFTLEILTEDLISVGFKNLKQVNPILGGIRIQCLK